MNRCCSLFLFLMIFVLAIPAEATEPLTTVQTNPKVIERLSRVKEKKSWRDSYSPKPELKCFSASIEKLELDQIIDLYCVDLTTEDVFLYDDIADSFSLLRR
jgi:hypothetical protein